MADDYKGRNCFVVADKKYQKYIINYNTLLPRIVNKKIVIFGAGNHGCKLYQRLLKDICQEQIVFCDNSREKQETKIFGKKVYSVEAALNLFSDAEFIMVKGNSVGYIHDMLDQILEKINEKQIAIIPLDSLHIKSNEQRFNMSKRYLEQILSKSKKYEKVNKVKEVKSITFRNKLLYGVGGGPAKVLEIQENTLGYEWNNIKLSYQFKIENDISMNLDYALSNCIGAIEFARLLTQDDQDIVYIVHDIFSAFGLAINGKKYILVYHSQGETAFEMKNMGIKISYDEEKLIKKIEMVSICKAFGVYFPSEGAETFFWKSWEIESIPLYSKGKPLYNCLIQKDMEKSEPLMGIQREDDVYTILSIGQMTYAKGIDRIPDFLDQISRRIEKEIRWIVVADGPLKDDILHCINEISTLNYKITFIQFDKLTHFKINYLFKISDIYLMLHRVSIFDLATLEAMYNNLVIILSDIPGNKEFNQQNNIIMVSDEVNYDKVVEQIFLYKGNNRDVYDKEFGEDRFKERYIDVIKNLVKKSEEE